MCRSSNAHVRDGGGRRRRRADASAVSLLAAVREGDATRVQALLADPAAAGGVAWDRPCKYGTALHLAAYHGQAPLVRFLLDHGADVNARNDQGARAGSADSARMYARDVRG